MSTFPTQGSNPGLPLKADTLVLEQNAIFPSDNVFMVVKLS